MDRSKLSKANQIADAIDRLRKTRSSLERNKESNFVSQVTISSGYVGSLDLNANTHTYLQEAIGRFVDDVLALHQAEIDRLEAELAAL